ncbi:NAD(P)/FAD-dependent oxidoreductase [Roseinatronobacter bogoriensis]|uniref:FAD-dependent oxidoreductase n=1 Tax=Roseinatronobacter bogoriensis subsp. barguzinensis TaxID=441209 RepID=A0A2K8KJ89_9RHOB|nr:MULTISPECIES: FAD-dependent oxidoreductase [Rhodobaca]ATX67875.1 FAD-dependent oxidoreductase [Rhodobaca barguzinensis]MBB4207627.1 D-amino-acid dehydrogenase [Rhodobaca bogoriensis DSM 18756]TDW40066.1 D-amino-acid dehydrogenase [Rhodobaca barguzinensis]TDY70781.1 D-amino-acid dehydrogenase [Rhodobaca bogoriensis DSM 18756]
MTAQTEVAVIGGGIVGLACALQLRDQGHEVSLIAPEDDETGASYGNAGVIADYAVMPVGTPDVLRNLPSLLFNRDSPLAIRPSAALSLAPWLVRFARESLPRRAEANARAIAALLAPTPNAWRDMAERIGCTSQLKPLGSLYFFETEAERRAADFRPYRALGVEVEQISRDELGQLQPGLPAHVGAGAAFFPRTVTLDDPTAVLRLLRDSVDAAGVQRIEGHVSRLHRDSGCVRLSGPDFALSARKVVLAAGAWSKNLAAMAGDRVPLDTERGYHLEYDSPAPSLIRQMTPVSRGFYFCPMAGRLRVAGTVELGGLKAPPSPHRWTVMERGARAILPDLPEPDRRWMGFRPSLPDSRPVIGPSRSGGDVIHAYGHGHLGLTLAPVTARIVADLIGGRAPEMDITPYRPDRF